MLITAEDIALKVGVSRRAVLKKPFLNDYLAKEVSFGGRPKKMYYEKVLWEKFGIAVPSGGQLAIEKIEIEPHRITAKGYEMEKSERKRAPNSSIGKNRVISEELEAKIKSLSLRNYLEQSRRDNVLRCVESAVRELWRFIEKETDKHTVESFITYFYMKRVMRKSNHFVGYYHSEKWDLLWQEQHQKNKHNSSLPTNRWDYISLFEDAGYIGEGYGAGLIWSIDATQFDAWIDDNGEAKTMNYIAILDGVTAMPLYMDFLEKGETIEAAADILWRCVKLHGKPKFGVVLDNGRAFLSKEIKAMVSSWYTPRELDEMASNEFRKRIFGGQTEPCIYPIAKVPRYPIKAQHERWFEEFSRFMQQYLAASYIGTRDSRAVAHELGSNPTKAVKARLKKEVAFAGFLNWMVEEVFTRRQAKLSFLEKKGLKANMVDLWRYYGGSVGDQKLLYPNDLGSVIETHNPACVLPAHAEYYAKYATGTKHEVTAGLGGCVVTEKKQSYNFTSEYLGMSLVGKKVKIVIDGDTGEGIIMKEWQKNDPDPRTPDKYSLYFVGTAQDAFIRTVADLDKAKITTKIRNKIQKQVQESTKQLAGKIEIRNKLNTSRYAELIEAECEVVEAEKLTNNEFSELESISNSF